MERYIYILSCDGKPLMPTKREGHIQKLLKHGKARIVSHLPFVIQLKYETENKTQPLYRAIVNLKVRKYPFIKNATKKIVRAKMDVDEAPEEG